MRFYAAIPPKVNIRAFVTLFAKGTASMQQASAEEVQRIDRKLCRKTAAASAADADSCHHGSLLHCEIGGMDLWHGVPYRSAAV